MSSLTSNLYQFGEFSLDAQNRVLKRGEQTLSLTPKAFDLLLLLIQNSGRILTKDELMKAVWPDCFVEDSNLTQTIFMVRKALDENNNRRYILNVQGQGYKFLLPVTEVPDDPATAAPLAPSSEPEIVSEVQPPSPPQRPKSWRWAAIAIASVILLAALSMLWPWRFRHNAIQQPGKIMLAVLPFENFTGDPTQEYFSDGLTEEMISHLGNLDPAHLGVIARTSVMHYKHSQASLLEIGKDLGVQYVVEGSVRRDSQRVRITAQLIQLKDQSHLWAREYDRDLGHLLELQEEIAREVANEIEFSLSGKRPIEPQRQPAGAAPEEQSYEAYDLYLKGRYCWNKRTGDGFSQAVKYFQQAIEKDRNYSRAYAGLADTFSLMSTWYFGPQNELMPKARAAALRALELDDTLAEAHASLALIKENYDYDWAGSEKEFRRAIQLNPQYATAHQWYAEFLSWQGRFPEAFAESEQARKLDPLSLIIAADHASILYQSRQYESAVKQCQSILDLDPHFEHGRDIVVAFYLQLHRYDEAQRLIDEWTASDPGPWPLAWKAVLYGRTGHTKEAEQVVAKIEQAPPSRHERTVTLLVAYAGTGEKELFFQTLQKAYADHSNALAQLKVDSVYDPMRSDPRFQDLLRRLAFQQ
jgi:TolB-like protein/DNA-binding winged helix-turn-helix (wHTH) protein